MDSEGTFPWDPASHNYAEGRECNSLGGAGVAPDNWWFLGGPDYGTFVSAGGVWSDRLTPGGGKSIMLDVTDPLVQISGGVTQVVAVNQAAIKPIRVSGYVAGEGLNGHPRINAGFAGYPPGFPSAGGGDLTFYSSASGDYDFVQKRVTFIPSRPVKYLFLHLIHRGFSAGKAWYGEFTVEELDMPAQVELPEGNCIINPNFFYSPDEIVPTGWDVTGATIAEVIGPLGITAVLLARNDLISQKNICIDAGLLKQKITVYAISQGTTIFSVKINLLDRYRQTISEKIVNIQVVNQWKTTDIYAISTLYAEKADIEITNIDGDSGYIGGVLLISQSFTPSKMFDIAPVKQIIGVPAVSADSTVVITTENSINARHAELDYGDFNGTMYLTDGMMGSLIASATKEPFVLLNSVTMTKLSDTEYTLDPWPAEISGVEVDGIEIDQYLRIPHVAHPDNWLVTTEGSIPAGDTRYYCVTALTGNGETDRSNEVRAITGSTTSTNRVPIEITPVEGVTGYRIYMTQHEDAADWRYDGAGAKKLIWDDEENHLVTEVTVVELMGAGYIIYDTGAALSAGFPPVTNTAMRWTVDNENEKVIFDAASTPAGVVQAVCATEDDIRAVAYVPHLDKYYIAGDTGVYESNVFTPGELILTAETPNVVHLSYNNELWYMTSNGDVSNLTDTTYLGAAGFAAFCFVDESRIARITTAGVVKIYDLSGNILSEFALDLPGLVSCNGLALYFGKLVTLEANTNKLIIFDLSGTVLQSEGMPVVGVVAWDISGISLVALTSFAVVIYRIHAQEYYAKLDKGYYLGGNSQQPAITRAKLPGEVTPAIAPELLANGTFEDGTTFPTGFDIVGPSEIETGFSFDVAVANTRAMYFAFPRSLWKCIIKYNIPVVGGRQYDFSLHAKATASSIGLLGVTFKDKTGQGIEEYFTIQYEPTYQLRQVIIQAPIDAASVDHRYLFYGSDTEGITYFLNAMSLKEELAPEQSFEHMFNGQFPLCPTGSSMPSGWSMTGENPSLITTAIEDPTMQAVGKALVITVPTYEIAGWQALQSQLFDIEEGDTLELNFYYKRGNNIPTSLQTSLLYFDAEGHIGPSVHNYIVMTSPTQTNISQTVFAPNPNGYPKAMLRIWPQFDDINYIESVSLVSVVNLNKIINPDFSAGLAGWGQYGTNMAGQIIEGLGVSLDNTKGHSGTSSCKLNVDRILNQYADVRQTITFNQTIPQKVSFSAWAAAQNISGGTLIYEVWIKFMDGTSVWDPLGDAQKWPTGTFDWAELTFEYTPEKTIKDIDIIINLGWGATGIAWLDDISTIEEEPEMVVDAITLDVPYTELNTETVKQIKITARLTNEGNTVNQRGLNVIFEASPDVGSFASLGTNSIGLATAIYTLPETACQVTLSAKYETIEDSKIITISPLVLESSQEPTIGELPESINKLNLEILVPQERKPLPDVTERIGRWEVFRPTVYNARQMLDYDMHYSPNTTNWPNIDSNVISAIYPRLFLFHYFDDLGIYPAYDEWHDIMAKRKEWYCIDATGYVAPFGDGRYYYNWRNLECVQWYIDKLIRNHYGWSDGIYVDDFWGEGYGTLVDFEWNAQSSQLLNFRSVRERLEASAQRLRYLRDELHKRGKYLTTNFGCGRKFNADGSLDAGTELLAMPFDGYLLETWLYTWSVNPEDITTEGFNYAYVKSEIDFVKWCGDNSKWVACLARSGSALYPARMFCLAAFLMSKHSYSYYCHSDWGAEPFGGWWHERLQPECFIVTGQPSGVYQDNGGFFSREFENCVALLNMSGSSQEYILPAGTWYTMRGASYTGTVTVTDRQGIVLVKDRP
jgi:hypothetical protein